MSIKKGTQVKIITGKDKGKTGEVLVFKKNENKIKVKSINMFKKHLKPTQQNKGGIVSKEAFLDISNVKTIDKKIEKKTEKKKVAKK